MSLIDKYTFETKGGSGCSNSDYHLTRTTCCEAYGVEDDELLDFYFDPRDLSRIVFLGEEASCPLCGAKDWSINHIENFTVMPLEWRWAAPRHLIDKRTA